MGSQAEGVAKIDVKVALPLDAEWFAVLRADWSDQCQKAYFIKFGHEGRDDVQLERELGGR